MPGGKNPSQTATPDTTPKLQDSSLQQGDVAMLQEGQQMMKQSQKPAVGGTSSTQAAPAQTNVQTPDAISFIGGRAAGTLNANAIEQPKSGADLSKWRPLMKRLARDPNTSGALSTAMMSRLSDMNAEPNTVGVDILDINAAEDMVTESLL